MSDEQFVPAVLPSGSTYPAVDVGDGILLCHPMFTEDTINGEYESAVFEALKNPELRAKLKNTVGSGRAYFLPLPNDKRLNWSAPISVHLGPDDTVVALLHYF